MRKHYEGYFTAKGNKLEWKIDPNSKIDDFFYVLEFAPNEKHDMWIYCSVGMSPGIDPEAKTEVFIFSPKKDFTIVELLTMVASYHKNNSPFALHHTFNIGRPWLDKSKCDHCFISLPYLDGEELELFLFDEAITHCYWLIPITKSEVEYKEENGCDALENLFEEKAINYLEPNRIPLV